MKKDKTIDELRPEYGKEDLGEGVRGKYLSDYRAGTNLVLLSPDVAAVFPVEKAVNLEKRHIDQVLKYTGNNRKQAASVLGISVRTLQRKIN